MSPVIPVSSSKIAVIRLDGLMRTVVFPSKQIRHWSLIRILYCPALFPDNFSNVISGTRGEVAEFYRASICFIARPRKGTSHSDGAGVEGQVFTLA